MEENKLNVDHWKYTITNIEVSKVYGTKHIVF